MSAARKTLYIKTYGCQMNVYDSQRMRDVLNPLGYEPIDAPDEADLVVLNTCHIREKASEKLYSELGRLRPMKDAKAKTGAPMTIAVAGCVAQAEGAEIMRRAPTVDLVVGPQTYHKLPELIAKTHRDRGESLETEFEVEAKFDALAIDRRSDGPAAFVTVQEGCDKFCTFCVVPYTRGAEWSRPVDQIVAEIRALAAQGVREVTLLGQNVNAFHGAPPAGREDDGVWGLGQLVRHIALIGGIERIRFTTSHPKDMDEDLIAAFADTPKLMPYFHLPVQSGSDKILKSMNRSHSAAEYIDDFEATMDIVRRVNYASCFSFIYSRRPGTPGAAMPGQVDPAVASERLQRLQKLLFEQQTAFNASQIGKTLPVLFERKGRMPGQIQGRSPYLQSVYCDGSEALIGQIADVYITKASQNALTGRLVLDQAGAA